ncbi:MAG: PilT/PilU family type 4a pilus ATPase [Magnetococcus sp. WYHC-3]
MSIIHDLLDLAVETGASDVHIKSQQKAFFRINSILRPASEDPYSAEVVRDIVKDIVPPHAVAKLAQTHEADFSLLEPDVGRFRVNVFYGQGEPSIALRHVKARIPTIEELRLPESLGTLIDAPRGVVILSGATGSGKSSTLAALIGGINSKHERRIITVEDPIEFTFTDERSVITQREVGLDTLTFGDALRQVLRQDPDVILIGEIREAETLRTALLASETGHLVFTTLHAASASQAVPRLLDEFPKSERDQSRQALATNLHAIICQRLIPDVDGVVIPAVEILFNTPTVRKILMRDQLDLLSAAIETGGEDGMQTFDQAIYKLIKEGLVTETDGMEYASNPDKLRMNLQGIFLDDSRRILSSLG